MKKLKLVIGVMLIGLSLTSCDLFNSLGGGAAASGVGGVDTRNWEGGLGYLDSGAFLGDGRDILATLSIAAGDGLEGSVHGAADGIVYLCAC